MRRFMISTKQITAAAKNAEMFFRMMRSIAPCAERSKTIKKERRYKYEEIFITVYGIYYVDDAFTAFGTC